VYLSTLNLIKSFFSFRADMSRDKNRQQKILLKTTWSNWNNNSKQLLNVSRHMRGNYISYKSVKAYRAPIPKGAPGIARLPLVDWSPRCFRATAENSWIGVFASSLIARENYPNKKFTNRYLYNNGHKNIFLQRELKLHIS